MTLEYYCLRVSIFLLFLGEDILELCAESIVKKYMGIKENVILFVLQFPL